MSSRDIRSRFIQYFVEKGHTHVPSSSLVPANDPTLLFTSAGMVQFKDVFLGNETRPYKRATTSQRCMRAGGKHNDIDQVGRTARHLTFFEMLGNFSFGDYYKSEACRWGWELVTEGYGIDADRLWPTVYEHDDEAFDIWADEVGVPRERIIRMGKKDNFWSMGVAGPCGPCSEIACDLGPDFGDAADNGPAGNEERYVEIWNLVFMQNDCNSQIEPVAELPKKNIDTGAGLERIAMVLQQTRTVFETDVLAGLVEQASELTGKSYGKDERDDIALRIIADHARSVSFMLTDGILPSNEERGYVLRLIMRRAIRHARLLGRDGPILDHMIDATAELMGDAYPELVERKDLALEVAAREEERFDATLKQGSALLEDEIERLKREGAKELTGEIAFRLHDTWGFPVDITTEIAAESDLAVDRVGFDRLMSEQRERARAARKGDEAGLAADAALALADATGPTEFVGYEHLEAPARIVGIVAGASSLAVAHEGDEIELVIDPTPFYAEGGGQVGDRGWIRGVNGRGEVLDTQRIVPGVTGLRVKVTAGELTVGDEVAAGVDRRWRTGAERAHTATHILHWVLRDRLGEHAHQAGSLVEPGRLRFDFNHFDALDEDQVGDIASEIQQRVLTDDFVRSFETTYEFARSIGAMAIFGEKYGDFVRVVEIGEYSKELCGGTHVPHTSRIGVVAVTSEGSVGANLRRIEALVGDEGLEHLRRRAHALERIAASLKATPDEVAERVEKLVATQKDMERRLAAVERQNVSEDAAALATEAIDVNGSRLLVVRRDGDVDALRSLAQTLKGRIGSGIVILGTAQAGRANLIGAVTKDLVERGVSAREILATGSKLLGGGGGGKPDLAISGGPAAEKLDEALEAVSRAARDALG
ncbi:MAG TPA: alanine--tRNA ligase [Actinomycetota bacterium]|nr:alanine--tRNA ligase [Actinomycetota bacterium]